MVVGPFERPFDYAAPEPLAPGTWVKVPLGRRITHGIVWSRPAGEALWEGPLKPVEDILDAPPLTAALMDFAVWMARYTLSPLGMVIKMITGTPEARACKPHPAQDFSEAPLTAPLVLRPDQQKVFDDIRAGLPQGFRVHLLQGVTGSGKTEVCLALVHHVVQQGGRALVLLPEIALATPWCQRFRQWLGYEPAVFHSDLSPARRRALIRQVGRGEVRVVAGARSALFLPFPKLDLVIADEEHDPSCKQDEGVLYHARDMAIARARHEQGCVVLCSATPSLETRYHASTGKYILHKLETRHGQATLPRIHLVDTSVSPVSPRSILSEPLVQAVHETLARQEQVLLFINRRGYAPVVFCGHCRQRITCHQCSAGRIWHKRYHLMVCHHCNTTDPLPEHCPLCGSEHSLLPLGTGIERVAEEVAHRFPEARVQIFSSDTASTARKAEDILEAVQAGAVDILIGTQMMTKGHHFPRITLAGVVDADGSLVDWDFRAMEKTWQTLVQVAGRSGRAERAGQVMVQTAQPRHPLMQALAHNDEDLFVATEMARRKQGGYPPFTRLAALVVSGPDESQVRAFCQHLSQTRPSGPDLQILGPVPAPLALIRGRWRWRFLVKAWPSCSLHRTLALWLTPALNTPAMVRGRVRCAIDIDPVNFS